MGAPPPHEMVHQGTDASGMEEWRCPECGRHFVVRWPPDFERLVLAEGDGDAVHVGAKGEPGPTGIQVTPAAGEGTPRSSGGPGCATTASTGTARSPEAQAASAGSGGPASVGSARRGRRNSTEATAPTARAAAASR